MKKNRMEELRKNATKAQLIIMREETLTKVDSYVFERERCVSLNPHYINYGLNTRINMQLKRLRCIEQLLSEREPKPILKNIKKDIYKKPVLDLSIPDGWHKMSREKNC